MEKRLGIEEKQYIQLLAKVGAVCYTLVTTELLHEEDGEENREAAIDKVISFWFCLLGNDTFLPWTQVVVFSPFCLCIAQLQFLW